MKGLFLFGDMYRLVGNEVVQCTNLEEYREACTDRWQIMTNVYGKRVSTVFLALDHRIGDGPPIVFETMVFPDNKPCLRYSQKEYALLGHFKMVNAMKKVVFSAITKANKKRRVYKHVRDTHRHRRTHQTVCWRE